MASVSIIGIGNMGSAIARLARAAGASVQVIDPDKAQAETLAGDSGATATPVGSELTGDIVVLAVGYPALEDVIDTYGGQLSGRIVVDITNPVDMNTFDSLVVPADRSSAALLAERVPGARVLKAFNTNFASTLVSGTIGGAPTTVLVAGDDADAKAALIELVRAGGLQAEDAGSLKRAREMEALGFLQIGLAASQRIGWTGGFAIAK
jgi:predicted dinucleotide-binding enzyme